MEFAWLPVHNNIALSHKNVWSIKSWEPSTRNPSMACRFLWKRYPGWWESDTFVHLTVWGFKRLLCQWNFWTFSGDSETELFFPVWPCHPTPLQYSWPGTRVCNAISQSQGPSSDQRWGLLSVWMGISANQDNISMVQLKGNGAPKDTEKGGGTRWRTSDTCRALDELKTNQVWGTGMGALVDTSWKSPELVGFDLKRNSVPIKCHIAHSYFPQNDTFGSNPNKPVITIFQRESKLCGWVIRTSSVTDSCIAYCSRHANEELISYLSLLFCWEVPLVFQGVSF